MTFDTVPDGYLLCERCKASAFKKDPKRSQRKYCEPCSKDADLDRKRLWAQEHPKTYTPQETRERYLAHREALDEVGAERSTAQSIVWDTSTPALQWQIRIAVPFTYAISKNHTWTTTRQGHVHLKKEGRDARGVIAERLRWALKDQPVAHNKLWLDIFVQKPNQKGDAVNVVDVVSDAVQDATGLDDRWFSVRRLDWEVVKKDPKLFIGLGQESSEDVIVCSSCGRVLPYRDFHSNKSAKHGVTRTCKECLKASRLLRKKVSPA